VKALSVRQPWASLIGSGRKTIELRSWPTKYRGPLLICSAVRRWTGDAPLVEPIELIAEPPRGVTIAVVELVDVRRATAEDVRGACSEPPADWYAWVLRDPRTVKQVAVSGRLGLFPDPR